jgi:glycosyltransferase involved in cell wall biosynthesis
MQVRGLSGRFERVADGLPRQMNQHETDAGGLAVQPVSSRLPRIALVVADFRWSGGVAGVTRFLYSAIKESASFDVEIVSLASVSTDSASVRLLKPSTWFGQPRIEDVSGEGMTVWHVGCRLSEIEFLRYMPNRVLDLLLSRYDLIQVVAGGPAWALPAMRCNRPVLLQVASTVKAERKMMLAGGFNARNLWRRLMTQITTVLERRALAGAAAVFVENDWMEEHCRAYVSPSRLTLAPPGIDTDFFSPSDYRPDGYLLTIGRLNDPRKNIRLLFSAYARACSLNVNMPELHLAGQSRPTPADFRYLNELGIAHRVKDRGAVSRSDLRNLYRGAGLFVLSSDEEGLGLVLLEAGASGLPIVSTATEGAKMVIAHGATGLLTTCGDELAFSAAMADLAADKSRRIQMGQAARQRVESEFSSRVAARRFLSKYREFLTEGSSSSQGERSSRSATGDLLIPREQANAAPGGAS